MRQNIGIIGIALPIILIFAGILSGSYGISDSISAYYYNMGRDVLGGSLFAIALLLLSYRGYGRLDAIAGTLAGVSAIGVALFPTTPNGVATAQQVAIGWAHFMFTMCFFLTLAFFPLFLFPRTDPNKNPTRRKQQRNKVYLSCGITIVACLVLAILVIILPTNPWLLPLHPILLLESLAFWAFGFAWFVKGETILKDE